MFKRKQDTRYDDLIRQLEFLVGFSPVTIEEVRQLNKTPYFKCTVTFESGDSVSGMGFKLNNAIHMLDFNLEQYVMKC